MPSTSRDDNYDQKCHWNAVHNCHVDVLSPAVVSKLLAQDPPQRANYVSSTNSGCWGGACVATRGALAKGLADHQCLPLLFSS